MRIILPSAELDSSPSRGLPLLLPFVRHRLSDSSPSRGLPLLLPFVRHRLSDSSPFRGLPLSALVRHQRSVSSATWPFLPFCGTSGASALPLGAGNLLCPFMALPRLAALAERQLCRT